MAKRKTSTKVLLTKAQLELTQKKKYLGKTNKLNKVQPIKFKDATFQIFKQIKSLKALRDGADLSSFFKIIVITVAPDEEKESNL